MVHRSAVQAEVRELVAIATLPSLYILIAPALSVTPVHDPATTIGGAILLMLVVIGVRGARDFMPRRNTDGRWRASDALFRGLWAGVRRDRAHWLRGLLLLAFALSFLDVYAAYKQAIPRFADYRWDPLLSDLDRAVHGGVYPWYFLRPILTSPRALLLVDWIYWLWYPVTLGFVVIMAWTWNRRLRLRFMLTFFATWVIGGTILAAMFASGGPVYFHHFAPDASNPYEPLIRALRDIAHLRAVDGHDFLLTGFTGGGNPRAGGISAMPSLHVAMAALCTIGASAFSRTFGVITGAYALMIIIGSVILGWHYAIDAYASIALVLVLWWLAGRIAAQVDRDAAPHQSPDATPTLDVKEPGSRVGGDIQRV